MDSVQEPSRLTAEEAAARHAFREMIAGLAAFCVKHGIQAAEVERTIRRQFVWGAREKFRSEGIDAGAQRIADAIGLPSFFVREALEYQEPVEPPEEQPEIADDDLLEKLMALVSTWSTETPYVAFPGVPLVLRVTGEEPTFASLARLTVPSEPPTRLLKALIASNSVELDEGGSLVRLVSHVIFYKNQRARRIKRFGLTVSALMRTLTANADRAAGKTLLERTLITDRPIPDTAAEEFQDTMKMRAGQLLEALDAESRAFFIRGKEGRRWGLCAFAFEVPEPVGKPDQSDDNVIDVLALGASRKR